MRGPVSSSEDYRLGWSLKNFLNICYLNATLQAFIYIPALIAYFLDRKYRFSIVLILPDIINYIMQIVQSTILRATLENYLINSIKLYLLNLLK